MSDDLKKTIEHRTSWYARFAGILIGFSITIAVLIFTVANEDIAKSPQYGYSLAAFIYSALAFFNAYSWYGRAYESSERLSKAYLYGSICYYTGYWSILLGLIYLTSLVQIPTLNYPFLIPFVVLLYTYVINLIEFGKTLYDKKSRLDGIILLVVFVIFIFISYRTIPIEPLLPFLRILNP